MAAAGVGIPMPEELDEVDRQLLSHLQDDARHTAIELAETVGVSDNTIHNRMASLEDAGIITGYRTSIDYEQAGFGLYFHFTCTARISQRREVAEQAMALPPVLEVTELMTGQNNLHIKMIGVDDEDITRLAERLDDLPLEINDENLIRAEDDVPLDFVEIVDWLDETE
jgi:DNA-binding Lrp family transcriptional regulator